MAERGFRADLEKGSERLAIRLETIVSDPQIPGSAKSPIVGLVEHYVRENHLTPEQASKIVETIQEEAAISPRYSHLRLIRQPIE